MSYDVTVNGKITNVSSYDAAKAAVKAAVSVAADNLRTPVRAGLFRSPKTTARVNADRLRSADKLEAGVKLPKTAGNVEGSVGGVRFAIARK